MKIKMSHVIVCLLVLVAICVSSVTTVYAQKKPLVVYTAITEKLETLYVQEFMKKYPDIEVKSINVSSGPITSRLIAEKANPQADVIFGLMESYLQTLKNNNILEPYERKDLKMIGKAFKDPDGFYATEYISLMAFGANTKILKEKNLPIPKTWEDLAKPIYKGMINIASPAQSGTGLTVFVNFYDMFNGWDYIDKFHKNVFQYNSSGGAAARQVARGECVIGITFDFPMLLLKNEGFPLDVIYPPNTPYAPEGSGLISGAKHPAEAKLFLDFLSSLEAMTMVSKEVTAVTREDIKMAEAWKPKIQSLKLYKLKKDYDTAKFVDEWSKRYTK